MQVAIESLRFHVMSCISLNRKGDLAQFWRLYFRLLRLDNLCLVR